MGNFKVFKSAVAAQFARMQGYRMYRTSVDRDAIWEAYLAAFPEGTNPVFRVRAEHDCSCCKGFIRNIGGVVAVIGGQVVSVWDVLIPGEPVYQQVAHMMAAHVLSAPIKEPFLHYERSAGTDKNFEQMTAEVKTWDHFFVNIDTRFVMRKDAIPTALGVLVTTRDVFLRGLTDIDEASAETVLELIAQGSLYRGEEHKFAVESFLRAKRAFDKLGDDAEREVFSWENSLEAGAAARIRGTVVGTLLLDIAAGVDIDRAVESFEAKVAPANYKRPTALATKSMVESAKKSVEELGLTSALKRRYANADDLSVVDVLFMNRDARRPANADVFDELPTADGKSLGKVEEVGIEKFLSDVLTRVTSVEVMVENRHAPNLVSLIAPEDPTARGLFKWDNMFSWSYNGAMADSIRERVKAAGGSVTGDLCCRLAWEYTDDLDLHMREPDKHRINFTNRRQLSPSGGMLDLDANGADGSRPDPAENIYYADRGKMKEGVYTLSVNNYARRSDGRGFEVEIEFGGEVRHIAHDKVLRTGDTTVVAKIKYSRKEGFEIIESLPSSQTSRVVWGLGTQKFHPVSHVILSPNHWFGGVGNKHYFFMVDGCANVGGDARGFFNEFLKEDLSRHRKVLEMVGGRIKVEDAERQLSGLGFSSTAGNSVTVRVSGSFTRTLKVIF